MSETTLTASPADPPIGSVRAVPTVAWVSAAVWAVLVVVLFQRPVVVGDDTVALFLDAVVGRAWPLLALALAAAPALALLRRRWGLLAGLVAFVPVPAPDGGGPWVDRYSQVLPILAGHNPVALQLAGFVSLCGVACLAQWRGRRSWWILVLALLVPAAFGFSRGGIDLVLPGVSVSSGSWYVPDATNPEVGSDDLGRIVLVLVLYAVVALLAYGLHALLFHAVRRRARERAEIAQARADVATDRARVAGESVAVAERAALARDLHDVVAHRMSLVSVRAETAPYTLPDITPETREVFEGIASDSRLALEEMRGILGVLHRSSDEVTRVPQPGIDDLRALLEEVRATGVDLTVSGSPGDVSGTTATVLYRVVQEGLTNARRHGVPPITVEFRRDDEAVEVRIANALTDERGDTGAPGRGLIGMRERVALAGGTLSADRVGHRFVLDATVPLA